MSNDSMSGLGAMSAALNRQTFGAEVVSKTLDYMNNDSGSQSFAPVDKQSFGAAVVSKTLDYMNSGGMGAAGGMGGMSQTYGFAKDVLGAYMGGRGVIADLQA